MALDVIDYVKYKIKLLLEDGFIRAIRYAEWISNIVLVVKKKMKYLEYA